MREISTKKRDKVVRLYFDGLTYDEIVRRAGVSKGSVVNIINELREGGHPGFENIADQVDSLRELVVDLRKLKISPWQARAGACLFERLLYLGVEPADLERWIKICHEMAPRDGPRGLVTAALELSALEEEKGLGYEAVLAEYEAKLLEVQDLDARIQQLEAQHAAENAEHEAEMERRRDELKAMRGALRELHKGCAEQRRRLEEEIADHLTKHNLRLEQVELVACLAGEELSRSGLSQEDVGSVMNQVREAGSLSALHSQLKDECSLLTANRAWLQATNEALGRGCSEFWDEVQTLRAEIVDQTRKLKSLTSVMSAANEEVEKLDSERANLKEDIDVAKAVIGLIVNPFMVTEAEFTALLTKMATHWSALKEARGQFPIQEYRHPQLMEEVRHRLAELLAPHVEDQFVPRWRYDQCEGKLRQIEEQLNALIKP